ncbi:proline-specific peptidase [Mycena olivaceomarginata]|nr:proline-specific peptidase [Mycena olivaceomarginata]
MAEPTTGKFDFVVGNETYETAFKVFGNLKSKTRPLLVLHGGLGIPHQYLLSFARLSGAHNIPEFWTEELFMKELDNVLAHFKIEGEFDLAGHSWGGHARGQLYRGSSSLTPQRMELWSVGTNALLEAFPREFRDMLMKHEVAGTFDEQHLCGAQPWPQDLVNAVEALEADPTVYSTMHAIGPSEFNITGTMRAWTVVDDILKISVPTLLINGRYDDAQDVGVIPFFDWIPRVQWVPFAESSHMPFFEDTERFFQIVGHFLTG